MNRRYNILVAGGGMVGLTVAALLSGDDRLHVTVVDAGERPSFKPTDDVSLRVSSIAPGSIDVLSAVGAWQEIVSTRACPFRDMRVWDASGSVDSPETLVFESAEFAMSELGFIVENVLVQHALLNQLDESGVEIRYACPIESLLRRDRRFEIELASGDKLAPDLVIGADGARSLVRDEAGIAVKTYPHAQKAFVTCLETELGHRNTAWQRFLQDGPVGVLPLTDGRVSIVWSTTPEIAESAMAMPDDELSARLTAVTDGALGKLTVAGPRGAFPLKSQHARAYVLEGLALAGDAAHAIHPLAGQGVNLGIADAKQLADVILAALRDDENPGDLPTLRRYERARKGANKTMLHFMDVLNRLFSNESAPLARVRGLGMYLFNKSGPVRDKAVRTALGAG